MIKTRIYYLRGLIESIHSKKRAWIQGYSANGENGGVLFPWMGKRECQSEAKRDGLRAIFIDNN